MAKIFNPGGFEPGVYFGLPEDDYFADPALGSTSMKALWSEPYEFWWNSYLNPDKPEDTDTAAKVLGSAIHRLVLEGRELFDQEYTCGPDQKGMSTSEKAQSTKKANADAAAEGLMVLKHDDYVLAAKASAMITKNPALKDAFVNGEPEVSVFWERDGLMRKARIDYLKIRGVGDLKTVGDRRGRTFPAACMNAINIYRYDMQAAHYLEARSQLNKLVAAGKVFGESFDRAWLNRVAASETFAFQWVFIATKGAPIVWSKTLTPGNGILDYARVCLDQAAENFRNEMTKHPNIGEPWVPESEVSELTMDELPPWFAQPSKA